MQPERKPSEAAQGLHPARYPPLLPSVPYEAAAEEPLQHLRATFQPTPTTTPPASPASTSRSGTNASVAELGLSCARTGATNSSTFNLLEELVQQRAWCGCGLLNKERSAFGTYSQLLNFAEQLGNKSVHKIVNIGLSFQFLSGLSSLQSREWWVNLCFIAAELL